jgi:hypothetical protein
MLAPELKKRSTEINLRQIAGVLRSLVGVLLRHGGLAVVCACEFEDACVALCVGTSSWVAGLVRPTLVKRLFSLTVGGRLVSDQPGDDALAARVSSVSRRWDGCSGGFSTTPLHIRKPQSTSYWSSVRQVSDAPSYFRQSL